MTKTFEGDTNTLTLDPEQRQKRGRTTVTPRALHRVAAALMAQIFGIPTKTVDVNVADQEGLLALTIGAPIPIGSLATIQQVSAVTDPNHDTILARVADAQTKMQEQFTALTGATVAHVTIRLNGVDTDESSNLR